LNRAVLMKETETVEFKKSLGELKEGIISLVAMLNKHQHGELWFGIAPNGKAVGLEVTEKTLRDVSQAIAAHIEPRIYPQVTKEVVKGEDCIRIRFDGQETPYYANGRAYMRVADEDRQLSAKELENLIVSKHQERMRWDNETCRTTIDNLDKAKLRSFLERAGLQWDTPENALEKLGLLRGGHLLNAAQLFFTEEPMELRCAVFGTTDSAMIIDRHDIRGDILELIEEAQKYVLKNIHIGMRLEGLYRVDVPEISVEALREAIINAFCHRDYRDPDYIQIAVFKDRVEIRNPGRLYGSLTLDDLRKGYVSQRRNPLVAEMFRRIEMVEAWGRGMPLILRNAPDAEFREIGTLFIVSFRRPSYDNEYAASSRSGKDEKGVWQNGKPKLKPVPESRFLKDKPVPDKRFLKDKSIDTSEKIMALMRCDPTITTVAIGKVLGISDRAVRKRITQLRESGLLLRTGGRKAGRWEVLK